MDTIVKTDSASPEQGRSRSVPLAVQATERLKQAILSGELLPGHPLIENVLAEELGMSKTPVREALRILSNSGLVTVDTFRTLRVRRLTNEDVRDIYEIRAALEPIAVEKACLARTPERERQIVELIEHASDLAAQSALTELVTANRRLHRELVRDCGNQEILKVLEGYDERLTLAILQGWNRADTSVQEFEEHKVIVDAFLEGSAAEAAALMRTHIDDHLPSLGE